MKILNSDQEKIFDLIRTTAEDQEFIKQMKEMNTKQHIKSKIWKSFQNACKYNFAGSVHAAVLILAYPQSRLMSIIGAGRGSVIPLIPKVLLLPPARMRKLAHCIAFYISHPYPAAICMT